MPRRKRAAPVTRRASERPSPQPPSRRAVIAGSLAVFVLVLVVYRLTLLPTVVDQDSGELVAAVHVLGIPHPTGYPLWALLGRGFDLLPLGGTSAYRVGLLSAVSAAAGSAIVAGLGITLAGAVAPGVLAGLAFGLWFPTWSQAVRAEVYGLTVLLVALALLAFLKWERDRSPRALWWLALAFGFVAMHHRTAMLIVAPAFLTAVWLTRPRRLRTYFAAFALMLVPFAFYVYLPLRAAAHPPVNWTNPVTVRRFLDHVLATQYQHFAFSHSVGQMAEQWNKLLPEFLVASPVLAGLLAIAGLPLIAWGWVAWFKRQPVAAGSLAAGAALLCVWVLQWGETSDLKVFFPPLGQVLALAGAVGLAHFASLFRTPRSGQMAAVIAGALVCALLLGGNWERSDLRHVWQHRDRWAAVLTQMAPDAIFISDNDVPSFATMYLQNVEGLRPDVTLIRVVPLPTNWYIDTLKDPALREPVRQAWGETESSLAQLARTEPDVYKWERTGVFAYLLAKRLTEHRPMYVLHGPMALKLAGPPYFVSLSEDLVRVQFEPPVLATRIASGPTLARFPNGADLAGLALGREEVSTGEMLGFTAQWELRQPLPASQFGLALLPPGETPGNWSAQQLEDTRLVSGFFFLNGLWQTPPAADGAAYEQRGELIVPSNAPAGEYSVWIGVGLPYAEPIRIEGDTRSPLYVDWTDVGRLRISARPLPTNGP